MKNLRACYFNRVAKVVKFMDVLVSVGSMSWIRSLNTVQPRPNQTQKSIHFLHKALLLHGNTTDVSPIFSFPLKV